MSNDTHAALMAEAAKLLEELKENIEDTLWTRPPAPKGAEEGWEFWQGQIPNLMAFSIAGCPEDERYYGALVKGTTVVNMPPEVSSVVFAARPSVVLQQLEKNLDKAAWAPGEPTTVEEGFEFHEGKVLDLVFSIAGNPTTGAAFGAVVSGKESTKMPRAFAKKVFAARKTT